MQLKFSRAGLNKSIQALADFMMKQNLYEQEHAGRMEAIGTEQAGRMEYLGGQTKLSAQEHQDRMNQIKSEYKNRLAMMPEIESYLAQARLAEMEGRDPALLLNKGREAARKIAGLAMRSQSGGRATSPEIEEAAMAMSENNFMELFKERGTMERSKEAAGLERGSQYLRGREIEQKGAEQGQQIRDKQIQRFDALTKDTYEFLASQGITAEGANPNAAVISITQGKTLNPMDPKDQGEALSALAAIRANLARGILPSAAQITFIAEANNIWRTKKEQGIMGSQTGLWPTEENKIVQQQVTADERAYLDYLIKTYGLTEPAARMALRQFQQAKTAARQPVK